MKTRNLILTLGVTGLVASTLSVAAGGALLSPRAAGNQIKIVSGTAHEAHSTGPAVAAVSPRAAGNSIKVVTGLNDRVNPATLCAKRMTASPKVVQACAANPANMPCCGVTAAK
ncbi:MAG TPA: hypothetical protein VFB55_07235 [Verrucomicrobiae bacterium]|nr:hypothetical protein [Verrucomicrobiae bacterium]